LRHTGPSYTPHDWCAPAGIGGFTERIIGGTESGTTPPASKAPGSWAVAAGADGAADTLGAAEATVIGSGGGGLSSQLAQVPMVPQPKSAAVAKMSQVRRIVPPERGNIVEAARTIQAGVRGGACGVGYQGGDAARTPAYWLPLNCCTRVVSPRVMA
jgi:hypothetical protein